MFDTVKRPSLVLLNAIYAAKKFYNLSATGDCPGINVTKTFFLRQ
jgi:hypothetical protein